MQDQASSNKQNLQKTFNRHKKDITYSEIDSFMENELGIITNIKRVLSDTDESPDSYINELDIDDTNNDINSIYHSDNPQLHSNYIPDFTSQHKPTKNKPKE